MTIVFRSSLDGFKTACGNAFNYVTTEGGKLGNYGVSLIKSIPEKVQDPRVAYGSIVLVSLIAYQVGKVFAAVMEKLFNLIIRSDNNVIIASLLGSSVTAASIAGFAYWTQMPINPIIIGGIAVVVLLGRAKLDEWMNPLVPNVA